MAGNNTLKYLAIAVLALPFVAYVLKAGEETEVMETLMEEQKKAIKEAIPWDLRHKVSDCEDKHSAVELRGMARGAGIDHTGTKDRLCLRLIKAGVVK